MTSEPACRLMEHPFRPAHSRVGAVAQSGVGADIRLAEVESTMAVRDNGAIRQLPRPLLHVDSVASLIGLITLAVKHAGERSAGNPHAPFEVAGAGNVAMAAGLRATAKAVDHPPEPNVGAPVLEPTLDPPPLTTCPQSLRKAMKTKLLPLSTSNIPF